MKVLIINSVCGVGSTGHIVSDLWRTCKQRGFEVKVAYGTGDSKYVSSNDLFKISSNTDYYLHNFLSRITDRAGFYSKHSTHKLIDFLEEYNPDIIHLHNLHGYYVNIDILFRYISMRNIPVVWTLHDCWALTGHCAHFSYVKCDKWKNNCEKCDNKDLYPKSILMNQSNRNYLQKKELFSKLEKIVVTVPSLWLKSVVEKSFLKCHPIKIIPNGIDLNVFRYVKSNIKKEYKIENKKIVLAVSNVWYEKKGLYDIIRLSDLLDDTYKLVVIGVDSKQKELFTDKVLTIKRTTDLDELVRWYSAADVFINPSYEETMGMTTYEALACETPVVVYDKTALPEAVNGENGEVVSAGNISELKEAIIKVVSRKDSYRTRKTISQYDVSIINEKLVNLYLNLYKGKI